MQRTISSGKIIIAISLILLIMSCAAGNERYSEETPAGFWAGLWHGWILLFTFIISLFSDSVQVYETFNSGGWYDFGFLLGVMTFFSGSGHTGAKMKKAKSDQEKEWEEIGEKVESKVRKAVKDWIDEHENEDWAEIGHKIEEKIKRELRDWADK